MSTDKDFKCTSLPEYTTTESTHKRQKLATALEGILPNSSLNGVIKGTHTGTNIRHLHPNKLPKSPVEVGSQYGGITSDDNKQHLFESLISTEEELSTVMECTAGQSNSKEWEKQRIGRITASNMHRIFTRMQTLEKNPETDVTEIIKIVMKYNNPFNSAATSYGIKAEVKAKKIYQEIMKKMHANFKIKGTGLHLCDISYVGASPDLLVSCDCCGAGLCEIKSPYSSRHGVPSTDLRYLAKRDGQMHLKESSAYYTQIVGQMGVCHRQYCDLFVYTERGHHMERIRMDASLWAAMVDKFRQFWFNYIAAELISPTYLMRENDDHAAYYQKPVLPSRETQQSYKPKKSDHMPLQNLCGKCRDNVVDDDSQCCCCTVHYHRLCTTRTYQDDSDWFCGKCEE